MTVARGQRTSPSALNQSGKRQVIIVIRARRQHASRAHQRAQQSSANFQSIASKLQFLCG
jgi:hypothetical protein